MQMSLTCNPLLTGLSVKFLNIPKINMFLLNTKIKRSSTNILKTINVDKSFYLLDLVDKIP